MITPSPSNSEWLTRKRLIDPIIKSAGWKIIPEADYNPSRPLSDYNRCAIEEFPTETGPADYALCSGGRIVGFIEAKKLSLAPQEVIKQTQRYSRGLTGGTFDFNGFHAPFLYATNGKVIQFHDVRHQLNLSRQVTAFHTPDALEEMLGRDVDKLCANLSATPNDHKWLRDYQKEANDETEKAIAARKREMLIAMATGTGKTFTMVNQVYRLMKSGVGKRILFLVDRKALAAQAVRSFFSFEPEPGLKFNQIYEVYSQRFSREDFGDEPFDPKVLPENYLTEPKTAHAFVYVSTIQRMTINLFGKSAALGMGDEGDDEDATTLDIPIHAFDAIIADECHRGYTSQMVNVWRDTLNHFDAIKIGLTATPAAHTTSFFRNIVFRYDYERAVREGHLVDYDVVAVKSDIRLNGVFLNEGEEVDKVDAKTGARQLELLEDERRFDASEVETKVTSPDSNLKILNEIKKYADEHQALYGRFPKTLIFAHNDLPHTSHADQIVKIAREVFGRGEEFVQKITGKVDRPLQAIRNFRNRLQTGVVVTVDLLTTGVDIPDLEYIVFMRPVGSRILFEQMLGRGTRKGENAANKSKFVVFDCFDGTLLERFRAATGITSEKPTPPSRSNAEIIEEIWQNKDRDYNVRCLAKRFRRIDKEMSGEAIEMFRAFIPNGDIGAFGEELQKRIENDFQSTMAVLRNKTFQDLLANYPRTRDPLIVALGAVDTVSSEWRVKGLDGKEYKPADYLEEFAKFVTEKGDEIQAISILLNHPKDWNPDALRELRDRLAAAPQRFTIQNLQEAHKRCGLKAMADIISMVKHAAKEDEELYTAEERVNRAFMKLTGSVEYTPEQMQWLERMRLAMVETLSISQEDFDILPVLANIGGFGRARKVFNVDELIEKLNEAIAA